MTWLYLVIIGQFLAAVVFLVDKYLISSRAIGKPVVYAFYIGTLSGVVILLLPFGLVNAPTLKVIWLAFAIAVPYILSIYCLYSSLRAADASDVAPVMAAVSALATLVFSMVFLKSSLPPNFFLGFPYLIFGTLLMSYFRFNRRATGYVILAAILFGLSSVFVKMMLNITDFWNGFFWSRMANVIGAAFLLIWPANLKSVLDNAKTSSLETKFLVIANKGLAGLAFLLLLLAIDLGDVSVVNALNGIQFVFLLIFAFLFTYKYPHYFHEAVHREPNVVKKVLAACLIIVGFLILFL